MTLSVEASPSVSNRITLAGLAGVIAVLPMRNTAVTSDVPAFAIPKLFDLGCNGDMSTS